MPTMDIIKYDHVHEIWSLFMSIRIVSKKIDVSQEAESCEPEARNVITAMVRSTKFSDASDVRSVVF